MNISEDVRQYASEQRIAEGSKASVTSTEMELKLTSVAQASLEELLLDYQDFLRVRDHPLWEKNSKEALYVRKLGKTDNESYESYRTHAKPEPGGLAALQRSSDTSG